MSRYDNKRKAGFLVAQRQIVDDENEKKQIQHPDNDICMRTKFNFSYFCPERPGYDFCNLNKDELADFYTKMREYGRESITHWEVQKIGKGSGHVFERYGDFPKKSDFEFPDHVPIGVEWGRFRMNYETRLAGFVVPRTLQGNEVIYKGKKYNLDSNSFYVVFLDMDHKFYSTGKK
ncbi:hypothetical protein [Serratia marcescens]|uniref:hypothetical protein n=1 Tax=Serratia marcescens TaxID=615 RepID=UPI000A4A3E4D|nr:hypothetical protein [Serratia marcescens]